MVSIVIQNVSFGFQVFLLGIKSVVYSYDGKLAIPFSGWLARDPSVLHRVGHVLLQIPSVESKRTRCFVIADDLFQLCKVPKQKTVYVVAKVIEKLSGCKLLFTFSFPPNLYHNSSMHTFECLMLVLSIFFGSFLIFLVFEQTRHPNI